MLWCAWGSPPSDAAPRGTRCHQWAPQSSRGPPELLQRGSPSWGVTWDPGLRDQGHCGTEVMGRDAWIPAGLWDLGAWLAAPCLLLAWGPGSRATGNGRTDIYALFKNKTKKTPTTLRLILNSPCGPVLAKGGPSSLSP